MMDQENLNAWAPQFRDAVGEIAKLQSDFSYFTKDSLDLEKIADAEPWEPCSHVLIENPNAQKVQVELITNDTKLNDVNRQLLAQKTIGLVVMSSAINRYSRPSIVVLTTNDHFYVIDGNDITRGIQFLKMKLQDNNLEFWLTNGVDESDCLLHNYGIDLNRVNVKCCQGIHIHLMQCMKHSPDAALSIYPDLSKRRSRSKIQIEKFGNLVEIWLDIDMRNIFYDEIQLPHLNSKPLNLTAINLIKKRCSLVLPLAKNLDHQTWLEAELMSKITYDMLKCCNQPVRQTLLTILKKSEERGEADVSYYAHVDCGKLDKF